MGKSKDLATGETRFVNTSGDTMTGNLAINNASGSQVTLHRSDTTIVNDDLVGQIIMSGDDADTDASGTRGFIRGRSQGTGGGLKMEFGTAGGGVVIGDPRMTINADGYVTTPNQPAFLAYGMSGSTNTSGSYWIFPNAVINTGNCYSTSTGRFTAPVNGNYMFFATFIGANTNDVYRYRLRKNLGNYPTSSTQIRLDTSATGTEYEYGTMAILMTMNTGDYASIHFESQGTDSHSSSASGHEMFSGYLLG